MALATGDWIAGSCLARCEPRIDIIVRLLSRLSRIVCLAGE